MKHLKETTLLITGANRGIGHALAQRVIGAGATCILGVRSPGAVAALQTEFASAGDRVHVEVCDIALPAHVHDLATRVATYAPQIDVLVNNAGIFLDGDMERSPSAVDLDMIRATFAVNLYGTIAMCQTFLPMLAAGGRIVNVSSTMGQIGDDGLPPYATAYCTSKTALNAYTSALANEVAGRGILVDSLHPGWVQTDMGGPNAQITPQAATETIVFLATRDAGETGKFWFEKRVIPW